MKKILFATVTIGLMLSNCMAVNAQHEKGKIQIDLYHGLPQHTGILFRAISSVTVDETVEIKTLGNLGLRFQYYLAPKFALGIDANYTNRSATINYTLTGFEEKIQQTVIRAMLRTSWEFVKSGGFEMNWNNSIGLRNASWNWSATDPDLTINTDWNGGVPIAFRSALGFRYMFTENVGLNLEVGVLGGALLNGGLTIAL
jgi:hypothetical protein|tara:strand:+ start:6329 stop:6928 length:600 start_codon:yes stop_codon:yes gene_type:complete